MVPAWLEAAILGIVQGLTEFIPVSSSGHLVLVPYLLGWQRHGLAFDVMLHVGTLGAVMLYFRGEIWSIIRGITGLDRSEQGRIYRRVGLFILPASVPIGLVGFTLADQVESVFESPLAAALLLLLTASLLLATEAVRDRRVARSATQPPVTESSPTGQPRTGDPASWSGDWAASAEVPLATEPRATGTVLPLGIDAADPQGDGLAQLTLRQAMTAGLLQCIAVLPGVSRSGSTIAGGVFSGLTREAATRFSFLLVIPALLGATALSLPDLANGADSALELGVGAVAAFLSGYAAVAYLVKLVSRARLTGFAYYCIAASAVGIVGYLILGPPAAI